MQKELHFALYAIKKNLQNSAELRTSFLMNVVGMIINNTSFILLWMFFVKSVGIIGGWTAVDIIGLNGYTALCYGIVFSAGGGIRKLADFTASGAFDRFMLSPKNLLLRVATAHFSVSAIGDIVFGVVCLTIYAILINANILQILLMLLLVIIATIVFLAAVIGIYSISFFFTDADSVTRGFFELFFTPSLFHGGAFQGIMRFIFTFAIPSLLIGALPVEIIRNVSVGKLLLVSILAIFWFAVAIKFFNWSIRKYESSNFMTFGN
ncbi:MAG: ABC-2 family transporter protein [Candidatus Gracilibacteria bacterium]|jgi:ABC-2 type transport system permease protein